MRLPGAIAGLLFALLALLAAPAAVAAPTWLPPVTLSPPGQENAPADIALAPDGTVIAVWERAQCTRNSGDAHECKEGAVQYSVRPPGGSFSAPAYIPGDQATAFNAHPRVAIDGSGNAIAIWEAGPEAAARLFYSLRPAGSQFGDARMLVDNVGGWHSLPSLAMAPDGRAVVVFSRFIEGMERIAYAIRPPGGDFGAPRSMIGDTGNANEAASVHIADNGEAVANWGSAASGEWLRYARLPPGGTEFELTQTLARGASGSLAMAPSGAAVMAWNMDGSAYDLGYAFRPPGSEFGTPMTLPEPGGPLGPRVAIDPEGRAVAAWTSLIPYEGARWATAPAGGPFGAPTQMPPGLEGDLNDLEMSRQGTALALWTDTSGPVWQMRASLRPAGGVFGDPALLPGPQQGANLFGAVAGFDPAGNAAALWNGRDPSTETPHDVPLLAAGLDGAGPNIEALKIPSRARERRRVAMSMTASDVWSPVASTMFDFGDGKSAPGPTARHRYRPGRYTVIASATDAAGNTSSATRKLRVVNIRPSISKLRVQPGRFPVGSSLGAKASKGGGATIRFRLSERATVRLTVQRLGRRAPKVGRIVRRKRPPGANQIPFSGRIRRRALPPGSYRIVAVAIDSGKKRSKPRRARFAVVR